MDRYLLIIFLLLILLITFFGEQPVIPQCPEDSVIIGTGQFDRGRWSGYTCGMAVDDY